MGHVCAVRIPLAIKKDCVRTGQGLRTEIQMQHLNVPALMLVIVLILQILVARQQFQLYVPVGMALHVTPQVLV